MTTEINKNNLRIGWLVFMIIAGVLFVAGLYMIQDAFAINATAINEAQQQLNTEIIIGGSFHVFWIFFLLVTLFFFMFAMFKMREDRETVFFALGSLIISIMLTLLFTSPLSFDIQEANNVIQIVANDTQVIEATVTNTIKQTIIIPYDQEFRFALVALFTGITLFNGLYAIYILTNYHEGKALNTRR